MKLSKFLTVSLLTVVMTLGSSPIFANNNINDDFSNLETYIEVSERVYEMQKTLKYLNIYDGLITGVLDEETEKSLKKFQENNLLPVTGVITTSTMDKVNENHDKITQLEDEIYNKKIEENKRIQEEKEKIEKEKNAAKSVDWWKEGQYLIPRQTTFKVTDVKTGKSFNVKRFGGSSHSDTEPLTKADTAIMKSIYGSWSWERRSIIVTTPSGKRIAASMNGMPHAGSSISGNNFNGHFCIHMLNSLTHGNNNLDKDHQNAIKFAIGK